MLVIKRDNTVQEFDWNKIKKVVEKAFNACNKIFNEEIFSDIKDELYIEEGITVEELQDQIEQALFECGHFEVAKAFILYRDKHKELRFLKERSDYIDKCTLSNSNTATLSEVDANANVQNKNVATIEAEVYKSINKDIQRYKMKKRLIKLFPEVADQYEKDLNSHIIYTHDEASSPIPKPYCVAVSMYPFFREGTSNLDGLGSTAPTNLISFCGQFNNLVFLLSSQYKGAVAFGEFFNAFYYYCVKEWGEAFWERDQEINNCGSMKPKTISQTIEQAFQNIVYSINQPAGNRSFQSPFTNISYYDSNYWHSLFDEFVFPDGTKPVWEGIDYLQRKFIHWFNKEREKTLLTFPVESMALLSDGKDIIDKEYKELTAEMYAAGHSFFTYISDNPDGLASCCFDGSQKVLCKSSNGGLYYGTFEQLSKIKTRDRKNFTIFHNGSWCKGKLVKLPARDLYKITTTNNKVIIVTDNHIHPTLEGNKYTSELTNDDYLLFNNNKLDTYPEVDLGLTYEQGVVIGAFLGDGSFGSRFKEDDGSLTIYDINFSLNEKSKSGKLIECINKANQQLGHDGRCVLNSVYNNTYPYRISSKVLSKFIIKWINWEDGTYSYNKQLNLDVLLQSYEFRKGILDGWYMTDGGNSNRCYTSSKLLAEHMEVLITSLGKQSIIDISDRTKEKVIIRKEEYNRNYPLYCVRWYEPKNKRSMGDIYKFVNNSPYFKIASIEKVHPNSTDVYCFQMDDVEEPYFTLPNGIITHNCRLRNSIEKNEFSFTNGLTGVATGSVNVITLNINRIIQDWCKSIGGIPTVGNQHDSLKFYLINILERVYKYHIAYKDMLYELYEHNMLPAYTAGYINLNQQFSTIGINGINEAAEFLGIKCSDNKEYEEFCALITSTISEENAKHRSKTIKFNQEFVPAESLAIKNYNWDKKDKYWVPEDRNCYNSYFYKPDDPTINVLERFRLQGKRYAGLMDGGVALHCNLEEHLSKKQYLHLIDYAIEQGTSYFTFNIPNSECKDCSFIAKRPLKECPKCGSKNITWWTRIIGYLRPITSFSEGRKIEANKRIYLKNI